MFTKELQIGGTKIFNHYLDFLYKLYWLKLLGLKINLK
jgi:hypothetical protein